MSWPWVELTVPVLFGTIAVVLPIAILLVSGGELAARWWRRRQKRKELSE